MKNEKNFKNQKNPYYVGLDIGTNSVGYAAANTDYSLCKHGGKPMWGVTLFDEAKGCDERRGFRTARRRLVRRKQRVSLLKELFAKEIFKVDETFYKRIEESALYAEDKSVNIPEEFFTKEYHKNYPTIHHLISELMNEPDKKFDLRLVYTACAWLVVHRGHFLNDIDADSVEALSDIKPLYEEFLQWFYDCGYAEPWETLDIKGFSEILSKKMRVSDKEKELFDLLFGGKKPKDNAEEYPVSRAALIKLLCGGSIKCGKVFLCDEAAQSVDKSIKLDNPETLEEIIGELGESGELLKKMSAIYDAALLAKILSGCENISQVKVKEYNIHKQDLKILKALVKKYCPKKYSDMFRGSENSGYSAYSANFKSDKKTDGSKHKKLNAEGFFDEVKKLVKGIEPDCEEDQKTIDDILTRIDMGGYMPKQVNSDNRVIPHQLFYAELKKILENASKHYDFLNEKDADNLSVKDKVLAIFKFRVPYFVGPLNNNGKNCENVWIKRKASGRIYPWNFEDMVDYDKCEQAFIERMTNKCSYLPDEYVLPKNSLLYCKFMVLNEINNIKINSKPISPELKQGIFNDLFLPQSGKKPKITPKQIKDYLVSNSAVSKDKTDSVSGLDTTVKSSMKPLHDFYRLVSDGILTEAEVEDIIKHSTYTEEKKRYKKWLKENFDFDEKTLFYVASKKYSDFGRLSKKLLEGIEGADKRTGEVGTVMHFLWNTNDNLMQIIADGDKYNFKEKIENINKEYYSENPLSINDRLDEMRISNAVKRPVFRTLEIMSDILKAKKCAPDKIFVEVERGDFKGEKQGRTKSRKDELLELLKSGGEKELIKEIYDMGDEANNRLQSEKLYLYFKQMGRCMYCGKKLDIRLLGTEEYNIDHIWPQAYIKDDSLTNNKVLVHSTENGEKGDNYPISSDVRQKMYGMWKEFKEKGLISEEKFKRLNRNTPFTNEEKQGFINRQLVETSQASKAVCELLKEICPETEVVYVKAGHVSEFRHKYGEIKEKAFGEKLTNEQKRDMQLVKCRSINDVHHAKDAYLNIVVGNVYSERFSKKWLDIKVDKYSLNYKFVFGNPIMRNPEIWNPKHHLQNVDRVMKNNFVHLTKFQTEQKGGFFDQNPVKPGKDLVPIKKGINPQKYGGYNKAAASFFVLASYIKGKKKELTLVPVELLIAKQFKEDSAFAESYVKSKLGKVADLSFPLGKRVIKINTVFSLDGFKACIAGKAGGGKQVIMRSLETAFFNDGETAYIKKIERLLDKKQINKDYVIDQRYDGVSKEENIKMFNVLKDKINGKFFAKMPGAHISLGELETEKFKNSDIWEQMICLSNLVLYLKSNRAGTCDMQVVGGMKNAAVTLMSANLSNWKCSDIRIVDRSASGIFETVSQNLKDLL